MNALDATCFICGVSEQYLPLKSHGLIKLCAPCEDTADAILTDSGVPYSQDLPQTCAHDALDEDV